MGAKNGTKKNNPKNTKKRENQGYAKPGEVSENQE
jgi:hypothetical protein